MSAVNDRIRNLTNSVSGKIRDYELRDAILATAIQQKQELNNQSNKIELLPAQVRFMNSIAETVIYRGGIRSGKTFIGALWSINKCRKGQVVLGIAPTYQMVRDNMVATLVFLCELMGLEYNWNASKAMFFVGGSYIIFRVAEAFERIRGFEACHQWFDEISFAGKNAKPAFERAIGRLSGMSKHEGNSQSILTSSPNGYDFACDLAGLENTELITQRIRDNWNLAIDYVEGLYRRYKGRYRRQELDAEIVDYGGQFFDTSKVKIIKPMQFSLSAQSFDLAYTTNKKSDFSSHAIGGELVSGGFCTAYAQQWKTKIPETKAKIKDIVTKQFPDIQAYIEANGTQVGYYDDLVMEGVPIAPIKNVFQKKALRMFPLASIMESGHFSIFEESPNFSSWHNLFYDQAKRFRVDDSHEHDDLLDAINNVYLKTSFLGESGFTKKFTF